MTKKNKSNFLLISDLGSGLNFKKRGLKKLLSLLLKGQIEKIVLTHKDRLLRFGSELIFNICYFYGVEIILIDKQKRKISEEEKLALDVIEIMTVFSARLHGRRSIETRRRMKK